MEGSRARLDRHLRERPTDLRLTKQQTRILAHHCEGLNLQQVALVMYISYSNVIQTVWEIKNRMGIATLAGCALRAHQLGLISHLTGASDNCVILDRQVLDRV